MIKRCMFTYEDGTDARAGRTAVLVAGRIRILVTERPVYVVGRRVFQQHGLEPQDFDVVVVKSPNGFRTWYESIAARIVAVDVPGSTSANLKSLPFKNCIRPIFPLDDDVVFRDASAECRLSLRESAPLSGTLSRSERRRHHSY